MQYIINNFIGDLWILKIFEIKRTTRN